MATKKVAVKKPLTMAQLQRQLRALRKDMVASLKMAERMQAAVVALTSFTAEVTEDDYLYVTNQGVWKRKQVVDGITTWVRSNPPPQGLSMLRH